MKALTLRQPWAGAVFATFESKDVENRSRLLSHRGELAIHAGQSLADITSFDTVQQIQGPLPVLGGPLAGPQWALGAVIGVVDVVSAHRSGECKDRCSAWAHPLQAHHRLANPRLLTKPVPAYGRQSIWETGDELEREIRRHLS